ncbi:hypothetical protein HKCCE4037_19310, partial [Rhodobacterales bacterium HKCCE4037]|nr:hypothetical protein [Rhodobacterales bacterium HKCCE4037]
MIKLFVLTLFFSIPFVTPSNAQVTGPITCDAAAEGTMIYNADHNVPQFCDGTNWYAMIGGGGGGGGGAGSASNEAIIDIFANGGATIDPVTIAATNDKWPDFILCGTGSSLNLLRLQSYSTRASYILASGGGYSIYSFDKNGTFNTVGSWGSDGSFSGWNSNPNCSTLGTDIDSMCDDGRCGFFGGGGSGGGSGSGSAITENDVTSSRSLNTIYQNTGTLPKLVTITHLSDT